VNEDRIPKRVSREEELLGQVERAIAPETLEQMRERHMGPPVANPVVPIKHPTIEHGESLAKHLESVMADYSKRVATAADLIRRTVEQLADDQTKIEKHLDLITKGCQDIGKIGSQR
jgi:hypothetical protein